MRYETAIIFLLALIILLMIIRLEYEHRKEQIAENRKKKESKIKPIDWDKNLGIGA
jgi:hypothetical protein